MSKSNNREKQSKPSSVGIQPNDFENRFWNLFESEVLSDVTLIVGDRKERIKSHKVILGAASPVFKKYFTEGEVQNEHIISTVEPDILRSFLKFMYTGEVSFESKEVIPIMNAAKYYQVQKLVTACEDLLKNALTEQSALGMYEQSILYCEKDLEESAKKIVCRFAHKILETDEFLEVSEECLLKFLGEDDLTVKSEVQVFDALIRWAEAECERQRVVATSKYCRSYLEKLIPLVRFPQMDEGDFALKVAHGQIQVLTQEELLSVYFYQKISAGRRSEVSPGLFNSKPRRYLDSVSFEIHVKTLNGVNVTLKVTPSNLILNVKEKMESNVGIPVNQQGITFHGEALKDGQTLSECNILSGSILQCLNMVNKNTNGGRGRVQLSIRTSDEGIIELEVDTGNLVEDLKWMIHSNTLIHPSKQRLTVYDLGTGILLDDRLSINEYYFEDGQIINLMVNI